MTEVLETDPKTGIGGGLRRLPLIVVGLVALVGAVAFRDVLSFETLRDNREALIAFRDAHYL